METGVDAPYRPHVDRGRLTSRRVAWLLAAGALAARVAVILTSLRYRATGDGSDYLRLGRALLAGQGMPSALRDGPSAFRPPGYPLLAAVALAMHDSVTTLRLVNAVIGTLSALLVGALAADVARRCGRDSAAPRLVALVLVGFAPPFVLLDTTPMAEPLASALLVGGLLLALKARHTGRTLPAVAAAAIGGAAVLVRPAGAVVLLAITLVVWAPRRGQLTRSAGVALTTLAVGAAVIVPWSVRNAVRFHALVPVTDASGLTLSGSFNDTARLSPDHPGRWLVPFTVPAVQPVLADRRLDERQMSAQMLVNAESYALSHPAYAASVPLRNLVRMVAGNRSDTVHDVAGLDLGPTAAALWRWGGGVVVVLGAVGLIVCRPRGTPVPVWGVGVALALAASIAGGEMRYLVPAELLLVAVASTGLASLVSRLPSRRSVGGSRFLPGDRVAEPVRAAEVARTAQIGGNA